MDNARLLSIFIVVKLIIPCAYHRGDKKAIACLKFLILIKLDFLDGIRCNVADLITDLAVIF